MASLARHCSSVLDLAGLRNIRRGPEKAPKSYPQPVGNVVPGQRPRDGKYPHDEKNSQTSVTGGEGGI